MLCVMALCLGFDAVSAASYDIAQGGFAGGGTLSGSFSGTDVNANARLTLDELSAFSLDFVGDSLVPDLHLTLADLDGFVYDLAGGPLGDGPDEGISTSGGIFLSGQAAVGSIASYVIDGNAFSDSPGPIGVRRQGGGTGQLPLPPSWALVAAATLLWLTRQRGLRRPS